MPSITKKAKEAYRDLLELERQNLVRNGVTGDLDAARIWPPSETIERLEDFMQTAINALYSMGNGYDPNVHASDTAYMCAQEYALQKIRGQDIFGLPIWKAKCKQWLQEAALSSTP